MARAWIPWVALGLVTLLVSTFLVFSVAVARTVAVAGVAMVLVGGVIALLPRLKPRDPYSLDELRLVHEEEELREASYGTFEDADEVVCPQCGEVRAARLPKCPRCGHL